MYEQRLQEVPEAIPLRRVAPAWRLLGIICLASTGALVLAVLFLGTWLAQLHQEIEDYQSGATMPPAPAPAWVPATASIQPKGDEELEVPLNGASLPYPIQEDLRIESVPEDGDRPRARFLRLSQEVWKCPRKLNLDSVVVSPDGQRLAGFAGCDLLAGPFANVQTIEVAPSQQPPKRLPDPVQQLVGLPAWSADSQYIYFASAGGRLYRFNTDNPQVEKLPFIGLLPATIPNDPDRLVFVRYEAEPRADVAGSDRAVLVTGNLKTGAVTPAKVESYAGGWSSLTVAPDGKRVAALRGWSSTPRRGIVVIDLERGTVQEAGPTRLGALNGPLTWTADGKALIYARSQDPAPPDCWSEDGDDVAGCIDLFEWDLIEGKETRLSRGAGFYSATLTPTEDLFFLERPAAADFQTGGKRVQLRRTPLRTARKFAGSQREPVPRDAAAWTALFARVCEEAKIAGDVDGAALTPAGITTLAEGFGRTCRARFNEEPPSTRAGFDRLQRELRQLHLERGDLARARLVVGAILGEHLRQKHGARWLLVKGALVKDMAAVAEPGPDRFFGYPLNPFQELVPTVPHAERDEDDGGWLAIDSVLRQAEGRPLVLTNDPAAARQSIARDADPDLERAKELLMDGKRKDSEELLLALVAREAHRDNLCLVLEVCRLLHDNGSMAKLRRVTQERSTRAPHDARLFNYLGLSLLDSDARQASNAFKKSLRCNLRYGPAYLNLAQAYEKMGETANARAVLRRCVEVMPGSPYHGDALRRLVALDP